MSRKTKKILVITGCILLGFFLAAGITFTVILAKSVDKLPMEIRKEIDFSASFRAMNKVVRARKTLYHTVPKKAEILCLQDDEVNALLQTLLRAPGKGKKDALLRLENADLTLYDGIFTLRAVLKLRQGTLFGQYLNTVIRFRFSYENGKEKISILSAMSGSMPVSRKQCMKGYLKFRDRYFTGTQYEVFLKKCIRKAEAEKDKGAVITYIPYNMVDEIDRLFYGGTGEFRRMMDKDDD